LLLIYKKENDEFWLSLIRIGSHEEPINSIFWQISN
jgi:mRNA-degrading endonuclease YafQ of YafQ-DinJ toxin-antitoxin module